MTIEKLEAKIRRIEIELQDLKDSLPEPQVETVENETKSEV